MQVTAEPPVTGSSPAGRKVLPFFGLAMPLSLAWFLAAGAWFCLMVLPCRMPTPTLEPSWQAVLNFGGAHHLQHGVDLVFTYGPLGYLMHDCLFPDTWRSVLLFQAVSRAVYLVLIFYIARRGAQRVGGRVGRLLAFGLAAALLPALDWDSFYLLFLMFAGVVLCEGGSIKPWHVLLIGFAAVFALIKTTFLILAVVLVVCGALYHFVNRRRLSAALILLSFVLALAFSWRVLGQQAFANFPTWLDRTAEMARSYQLAMGVPPSTYLLVASLLVFAILASSLCRGLKGSWSPVLVLALCALILAWKQGFTRGDQYHQRTFFDFALVLSFSLPLLLGPGLHQVPLALAIGLWLVCGQLPRLPLPLYRGFENARFLVRSPRLDALWAGHAQQYALPEFRRLIGSASVDVAGAEQAIALLNGFNYRPAPVFQSYAAGTFGLAQLNADYYRSARAPDFIITHGYTIDDRLPNLDDSLSGWIIAQRYRLVASENGFRLLQRVSDSSRLPHPLMGGTLQLGEKLQLQPGAWCELHLNENASGRLLRALWACPPVLVKLWRTDGNSATHRFVPSMGASGFVVPENAAALAIVDTPAARWLFKPAITYRLEPPLQAH